MSVKTVVIVVTIVTVVNKQSFSPTNFCHQTTFSPNKKHITKMFYHRNNLFHPKLLTQNNMTVVIGTVVILTIVIVTVALVTVVIVTVVTVVIVTEVTVVIVTEVRVPIVKLTS